MSKKNPGRGSVVLLSRLRVLRGAETALGPGRVELLEYIAETGSLRAAAERMDMSYMRAWSIVKSLNGCFRVPLVESARGGSAGGGAKLTVSGRRVIALYRQMERQSQRAAGKAWKQLREMVRRASNR